MNILDGVQSKAKQYMRKHHFSGHDFTHIDRVSRLCKLIGREEGADMLILEAAALLHDLGREHERKDPTIDHAKKSAEIAKEILKKVGFPKDKISKVVYAIKVHRFSKKYIPELLEAQILQDADRIDICGAIGVAITFAFGGAHNRELYHVNDPFAERRPLDDRKYCLDHFFTKLLKLADNMHTSTGRKLAKRRRKFMEFFLKEFRCELEGRNDVNPKFNK